MNYREGLWKKDFGNTGVEDINSHSGNWRVRGRTPCPSVAYCEGAVRYNAWKMLASWVLSCSSVARERPGQDVSASKARVLWIVLMCSFSTGVWFVGRVSGCAAPKEKGTQFLCLVSSPPVLIQIFGFSSALGRVGGGVDLHRREFGENREA